MATATDEFPDFRRDTAPRRRRSPSQIAMLKRVFGLGLTLAWLAAGVAYVVFEIGLPAFMSWTAANYADFSLGLFAPLVFLWLVIGYIQQGQELAHSRQLLQQQQNELLNYSDRIKENTDALAKQTADLKPVLDNTKIQAAVIRDQEVQARRETLMRVVDVVFDDLEYLLDSIEDGVPEFDDAFVNSLWVEQDKTGDDVDRRYRCRFIGDSAQYVAVETRFREALEAESPAGVSILHFAMQFGALIEEARKVDIDHLVRESLIRSRIGRCYVFFKQIVESQKD